MLLRGLISGPMSPRGPASRAADSPEADEPPCFRQGPRQKRWLDRAFKVGSSAANKDTDFGHPPGARMDEPSALPYSSVVGLGELPCLRRFLTKRASLRQPPLFTTAICMSPRWEGLSYCDDRCGGHGHARDFWRVRVNAQRLHSISASRFTAGASGFFDLTQCSDRPET
jgi:hypothetical protein